MNYIIITYLPKDADERDQQGFYTMEEAKDILPIVLDHMAKRKSSISEYQIRVVEREVFKLMADDWRTRLRMRGEPTNIPMVLR